MKKVKTTIEILEEIKLKMRIENISHKELSNKIGLSRSRTTQILNNMNEPRNQTILDICKYLDIDVSLDIKWSNDLNSSDLEA